VIFTYLGHYGLGSIGNRNAISLNFSRLRDKHFDWAQQSCINGKFPFPIFPYVQLPLSVIAGHADTGMNQALVSSATPAAQLLRQAIDDLFAGMDCADLAACTYRARAIVLVAFVLGRATRLGQRDSLFIAIEIPTRCVIDFEVSYFNHESLL
jgi:hypothetical protein